VVNTTGAPCFDRAGDGPIPLAQQKFSAPGIKFEQVRARPKIRAPLPPAPGIKFGIFYPLSTTYGHLALFRFPIFEKENRVF
jgi:hypothetical protein